MKCWWLAFGDLRFESLNHRSLEGGVWPRHGRVGAERPGFCGAKDRALAGPGTPVAKEWPGKIFYLKLTSFVTILILNGYNFSMVYILEDDESIRKLIVFSLENQGFECRAFWSPSEFWKAFEAEKPELILLDLLLPEEDGISILKKIRDNPESSEIPVIILTAKDSETDVSNGLDSGADDYVVKPFGMSVLVSRIKAVLRRCANSSDNGYEKYLSAGDIKVDLYKHTAYSHNEPIMLTLKEFDLLSVLIENRGKAMSREKLLNLIWNIDAAIESRTVDVHIRTLRMKIGDLNAELIQTVRGVGYKVS